MRVKGKAGNDPQSDVTCSTVSKREGKGRQSPVSSPTLQHQVRIILENCGQIGPTDIRDYCARGGYKGLGRALNMSPPVVIEEIEASGLRERGGEGCPIGSKWRSCQEAPDAEKWLVCSAHEGDPEAFVAKTLLERDPHSVLEGMLIGAYGVGATRGYLYINDTHSSAIETIHAALRQMRTSGLLGDSILGSDFSFEIELRTAPAGLIYGEEGVLLDCLEAKPPAPYSRPPVPAGRSSDGMPTVVDNVETWANVSAIFKHDAAWFSRYGSEGSKGTKIFVLSGRVMCPGLVEVPFGTTLRRIVYEIGGGTADGRELKALQIGGPAGACVGADALDLPVDYEHMEEAGIRIGSGRISVIADGTCLVDLAGRSLRSLHAESCGGCVLGREGTRQMAEILTDITGGRGKLEDLALLLELSQAMKLGSRCGFCKTAPDPVLTTMNNFRDEYVAHIKSGCPAGSCRNPLT